MIELLAIQAKMRENPSGAERAGAMKRVNGFGMFGGDP